MVFQTAILKNAIFVNMEKLSADKIIRLLSADAMRYFFPGYSAMESIYHEIRFRIHDSGKVGHRAEITHDYLSEDKAAPATTAAAPTTSAAPAAPAAESEFDLDPKTKALLDEIEAIKVKYGITIEELEAVLSYRVKLSHLRITRHKEIILDDFDHREVKMDALTKSIFLLYLKHPEGIRYKELCDHRSELEEIYLSISGRSDMDSIRKSIDDLTDPITSNSINEKVSRAKKAFREVVDVRIARFYYIDGRQGAAKRIALDRSLVIWE